MPTWIKVFTVIGLFARSVFAETVQHPGAPHYSTVAPAPLELASKSWGELQFIQADLQGRVFVLRGSPALEVYRLENGALRFIEALQGATAGVKEGELWVEPARLSRGGDAWFLFVKPTTIEVFEGGKRTQTIESHWEVTDLAEGSSKLVVAVSNSEINTSTPEGPGLVSPPLVREWDGRRWATLIQGQYRDEETRPGATWHQMDLAAYTLRIAFTPEGQLWVANAFAPRLRHYSASGSLEDEIVQGDGKISWLELKPDDVSKQQAKVDEALTKAGFHAPMGVSTTAPREACRGIAVGRDGYIYLLADTEQGLALDRYLPSLPTYERVLLTGLNLGTGRPSFIAGRSALIVGARIGNGGTWEIPYEALTGAKWESVPGVTRNGIQIEEIPSPEPTTPLAR